MSKKIDLSLLKKEQRTSDICMEAVKQDGINLFFIYEQTEEMCLIAVKNNGMSLAYVENQTYELCLAAITTSPMSLCFVQNQSKDICLEALKKNIDSFQAIKDSCGFLLSLDAKEIKWLKGYAEHIFNTNDDFMAIYENKILNDSVKDAGIAGLRLKKLL